MHAKRCQLHLGATRLGTDQHRWLQQFAGFGLLVGVAYAPYPADAAWFFRADVGHQNFYGQGYEVYAVAVRPGDVTAAVPEPQTYAVLLMGVSGVLVAARRRAI